MAGAVYALWQGESTAPLITPALLPFRDVRVRTALLEPLDRAYGPILQQEVDGDQALTAAIEARRPRIVRAKAAKAAARAVFFATAPHAGDARGGLTGAELRLACARPGDRIAVFGEALQDIASRAAYFYRDGDRYWFSPRPTLNKLAADHARDVDADRVDRRIVETLREEARERGGFHRVHAAPDDPTDVEDRRDAAALVILPPAAAHDGGAAQPSAAETLARDTVERRGSGQRHYRNALAFVAADAASLDAVRKNARRELAWRSILGDADLRENMTRVQATDAEGQRERGAAPERARRMGASPLPGPGRGREGRAAVRFRHAGRAGGEPGRRQERGAGGMGQGRRRRRGARRDRPRKPDPLPRTAVAGEPAARSGRGAARVVRFLRLPAAPARRGGPRRCAAPPRRRLGPALRARFPVRRGDRGLPRRRRRKGAPAGRPRLPPPGAQAGRAGAPRGPEPAAARRQGAGGCRQRRRPRSRRAATAAPRPKRFFASLKLDPERAGLDVARIMDGLLVELTRAPGAGIELTLETAGTAGEAGYPPDVVDTVTANARDLKLDEDELGFEKD